MKDNYTSSLPNVDTSGPRNDFGPREFADIANGLLARQRNRTLRLSRAGRLRKWGA